MPELTPKLGIKKPLGNETVSREAFNENWDIIDQNTVADKGGVPSIQAGLDAEKPTPGTAGRLYVATDMQMIYRDTGTAWQKVGAVKWDDIEGKPSSFTPATHGNEAHDPDFALASDLAAHLADNEQQFLNVNLNIIDMAVELETLKGATLNGVTANIFIETFANLNDIDLMNGVYDSTNKRLVL